jgi:hypothetical protein
VPALLLSAVLLCISFHAGALAKSGSLRGKIGIDDVSRQQGTEPLSGAGIEMLSLAYYTLLMDTT